MKNFSVAIFGSSIRTNYDKYSDKDLIIVANNYEILNKHKIEYELKGFSVSTYTYKKLEYLSKTGSLFIQHLKQESMILIDSDSKLKSILECHKELLPTSKQISDSIEYFELLKYIPDTQYGYAWYCDCFYVGLRNYLILKSAENSNYNFSYLELIKNLVKLNFICNTEYEILRQLRVAKKNYRDRITGEYPSKEFVISLISIGYKLNLLASSNFIEVAKFKSFVKIESSKLKTNHYFKLRLVEIYYLLTGQRKSEIDNIICNPQFYALKFKNKDFIANLMKDIEGKTANNITLAIDGFSSPFDSLVRS